MSWIANARKIFCLLGLIGLCALSALAQKNTRYTSFKPGELWLDNKGVHINAHGGGMLYHQRKYYWFGEHKIAGRAGNVAHVGVHCYSSTDLYNWKDEGIALSVVEDNPASEIAKGRVIERPKVIYNRKTKKFVMWFHLEPFDRETPEGHRRNVQDGACAAVAVSDKVTGPYRFVRSVHPDAGHWPVNVKPQHQNGSYPKERRKYPQNLTEAQVDSLNLVGRDMQRGQQSRDMTLFVDDDGKAYHIYSSEENTTLHISELTDDYMGHTGRYKRLFVGRYMEAPAMFKHNGKYYLMMSGCTGWKPNEARSAVADSIFGEWRELGNPCVGADAQTTFHSQSTYILPVAGKKDEYIYMGDRWKANNAIDGRYVWLPIRFENDRFTIHWRDEWQLKDSVGMSSGPTIGAQAQSWPASSEVSKPGTRWWWMGSAVNEDDLRWNIQQYHQVGLGALEITPVYGVKDNERNEIDFLSPRWMDMLRVVEKESNVLGMRVDMNTGTGWPFGGPFVPIEEAAAKLSYTDVKTTGAALREGVNVSLDNARERTYAKVSRVMAYVRNAATGKVDEVIDLTAFTTSDGQVTWKKATKKKSYHLIAIYCSRTLQKVKRAAPGGYGYVIDHFDKKAVAHYLNHFTQAFETTKTPFPSVFFNDSYEVFEANWTPALFEEFEKRRGYKLEDHLLELLGLLDDGNKVLSDYRETLGEMLLENFTIQWTEWAHQHGVKTRNQAHGSPADVLDVFSVVDIPETEGFDTTDFGIRGLRTDSGFTHMSANAPWMLKMASSAAHVGGKALTSCESFTWQTEHFRTSLSQIKPEVDYLFTSGVNHVFFHGTAYSPRDVAWPGWKFYASMDMSPTNSIWRDAPFLMKYIERCQSYLQSGGPTNDLLVLMPVREMWHKRIGTGAESLLMQFDFNSIRRSFPEFVDAMQRLERTGVDYDYVSERNMLGLSCVDGKLQTAAGTRYTALVILGKGILSDAAKSHLDDLRQQGASIIYGIDSERIQQVAKAEPMCKDVGLRMIRRKNQEGYFYFIANLSPQDIDKDVKLAVDAKDARWFDPMDGKIYKADLSENGVKIRLKSGESMILQTYQTVLLTKADDQKLMAVGNIVKPLNGRWSLSFKDCAPMVDKTFSLDTLQTWETLADDSVKVTMGTGVYTTTVTMTAKEVKEHWMIDLGDVRESARVYVNDRFVGCAWAAPFELKCGNCFRKGRNTIRIEVTNLPANRIAEIDRKEIPWRNFKEINFVDINYKRTSFANWKPVKSGLNSPVYLRSLR